MSCGSSGMKHTMSDNELGTYLQILQPIIASSPIVVARVAQDSWMAPAMRHASQNVQHMLKWPLVWFYSANSVWMQGGSTIEFPAKSLFFSKKPHPLVPMPPMQCGCVGDSPARVSSIGGCWSFCETMKLHRTITIHSREADLLI